jgi:exosome complex component RRP42
MSASKTELSYTTSSLSLKADLRSDGRGPLDYRPIRVSTGLFSQANGSACVQCGGSKLSVGVTCSVTTINLESGHSNSNYNGKIVCNVIW